MQSRNLLITRSLDKDQKLRLIQAGYDVADKSLIDFSCIEFELPKGDTLFFYSQNAVDFTLIRYGLEHLKGYQIACLGQKTGQKLAALGLDVKFVGTGDMTDLSRFIKVIKKDETIIFLQAKNSIKRWQKELQNLANICSVAVYDNSISDIDIKDNWDIVAFTSPLNVEAFFKVNNIESAKKWYAIGKTTAIKMLNYGVKSVIISKTTDIDNLISEILL